MAISKAAGRQTLAVVAGLLTEPLVPGMTACLMKAPVNPYEVGNFEAHDAEVGPLYLLLTWFDILVRLFFGVAICGLIVFFLYFVMIFGLQSQN